ncbi:Hypothetical predicted protein [Paramuricea clavata]|uniref:Uncharacterized protein n=1 Tax=Paramuricea clavata TaxID=317549 RepID=A0A7D9HZ18_PARCT|nr:Hypothetical predicted protein [Paramuricea clavata]
MATALPTFPSFDPNADQGAPGVRFKKYIARFRNLIVATDIDDPKRQKALLLHYIGEEVNDIFETLTVSEPAEEETVLDVTIKALSEYFTPKQNPVFEEYKFRNAKQTHDEALMTYYTRLKQLSLTCEFHDADREIKSQIIQHGRSQRLRRKALIDPTITLAKLLEMGKAAELADSQAANLERTENVSHFTTGSSKNHNKARLQSRSPGTRVKCRNCGGTYPHEGGKTACPAYGKECRSCGKLNHFQSVCLQDRQRSNPTKPRQRRYPQTAERQDVRAMDNTAETDYSDDSDEVGVFRINVNNMTSDRNKHPLFDVTIEGTLLTIMADSGSSINILDEQDYNKLSPRPSLEQTRIKVYPYQTETPLPVLGQFTSTVASETVNRTETFYVVKGTSGSLLSWRTSTDLQLLKVVKPITYQNLPTVEQLTTQYQDLFQGLGKLKDYQVQLHIDEGVPPVAQPHRRVPFHVPKQHEEQLSQDEKLGVIERRGGPNPLGIAYCCGTKAQVTRKAVQRERHITPTIKEIIADLNGANVFSKLDLNQGYNQLELAPESRYITTFSTQLGLMRYKRLNFGISSAAEIFLNAIRESLDFIPGAINISDDILVFGKTQKEHDQALAAVFQRLRERGLTLNKLKCEYSKNSLEFFGYVFGADGNGPRSKESPRYPKPQSPNVSHRSP